MEISIGFSPCPNDTFIFDALVNKKIDTEGLDFVARLEDVETLNQWALAGRLPVSKISYAVLPLLLDHYQLLDSGGALGKGVGPLLIARQSYSLADVPNFSVAVPGKNTSAHMLFSLAFPQAEHKQFMIFSGIEDAVLSGTADCGVIIHENRFTYMQKGLVKLLDLGEFWEQKTGCPIPLGGIVASKELDPALRKKIDGLIKKSLEYSFAHYPELSDFVKDHAREMDPSVMRQHIDLYVNQYSLSLGEDGRKAVDTFLQVYTDMNSRQPVPAGHSSA
ncbi:MAG TPA: 1,4-dihydroxy-6-naphthoate synthase [Puia sp.]|nr:1,4-dihydroxy-6-naphthoate synthase [Puia sp.]